MIVVGIVRLQNEKPQHLQLQCRSYVRAVMAGKLEQQAEAAVISPSRYALEDAVPADEDDEQVQAELAAIRSAHQNSHLEL
ncbi:hypothetical protein ACLKA6_010305 [Drosophila palustris]